MHAYRWKTPRANRRFCYVAINQPLHFALHELVVALTSLVWLESDGGVVCNEYIEYSVCILSHFLLSVGEVLIHFHGKRVNLRSMFFTTFTYLGLLHAVVQEDHSFFGKMGGFYLVHSEEVECGLISTVDIRFVYV